MKRNSAQVSMRPARIRAQQAASPAPGPAGDAFDIYLGLADSGRLRADAFGLRNWLRSYGFRVPLTRILRALQSSLLVFALLVLASAAQAQAQGQPAAVPGLQAPALTDTTKAPPPAPRAPRYVPSIPSSAVRVTNVFFESDLLQALRDVSSQTGVAIVTDGTVGGVLSMELVDVPFEDALGKMLYPLGFTYRKIKDYYLVGSAKPGGASFYLLSTSETVTPNYLKAEDAYKLLPDHYHSFVKLSPETNALTITAPQEIIAKFREDLDSIDQPKRQVLIEALVTEISRNDGQSLGVDWSGTLLHGADTFLSAITNTASIADTVLGIVIKALTGRFATDWAYNFIPSINALVASGKMKIRANPKVVTLEGQPASINVTKEQYYQIVTGSVSYPYIQLDKIEAGVSLNITPWVSDNDDITLSVEPNVSDVVGYSMTKLPIVSRRSVKTSIRVKDGEKIVIGGLLERTERDVRRRIPILGQIPILGLLFSNTVHEVNNSEVVVIITPHLLKS